MAALTDIVPDDALSDVNHAFWGPSPDVRARNFRDPERYCVKLHSQAGTMPEACAAWVARASQAKKDKQAAWDALTMDERIAISRIGVSRALRAHLGGTDPLKGPEPS